MAPVGGTLEQLNASGVKSPLGEIWPTVGKERESTLQVTAVLLVPLTDAVNWMLCEPSKTTVGFCGEMVTVMPPAVARMVTMAEADLVVSSWLVAVTVTWLFGGKFAGAV